jgi:dipeptide transport system permease protein
MGLKTLIARRVLLAVPVAIGVVTVIFAVLSVMTPIMRVAYFVGGRPNDFLSRAKLQYWIHFYGLDQPIPVQYVNWLKKVAALDFGFSFSSGKEAPVMSVVLASLPPTLELVLYSAPFILWFPIWLGTRAAVNQNKTVDHIARVIGTLGTSVPVFLTGVILIMISLAVQDPRQIILDPYRQLSYNVGIDVALRTERGAFTQYTGMISIDALLNGDAWLFLDAMMHLILPVLTLVSAQSAALIKVTRSGLIGEFDKPYVVSAMTKGLSKEEATYKHVRKNASISVLTVSSLLLGNMFVSLMIVEKVFNRPGFASLVASSAIMMDTPVLFACAMLIALFYVLLNLVVDILYAHLDPRIKLG